MEKRFPVLDSAIFSIPFSVLEPHRQKIQHESGQTLERLAERGGLSADELDAIGFDWRNAASVTPTEAPNDPVNAKEISVTPEEIAELIRRGHAYAADLRALAVSSGPQGRGSLHVLADTFERQAQVIQELDTLLDSALA